MTRALSILLLLALCGCVSVPTRSRAVTSPPLPTMPVAAATVERTEQADPIDWSPVVWLWWDSNPNDKDMLPYMLTEIHSTTNLSLPFTPYITVPPGTNAVCVAATNVARFFIARFALTNSVGLPWVYSEWSCK